MFYLKTCSFNGIKPRFFDRRLREGVFCIDPPEARFSISPCDHKHCNCCHPSYPRQQRTSIPFLTPHIHRFVNQYEAILNCPAVRTLIVGSYSFLFQFLLETCQTENCIYVLTCPCGQFDFVGLSKLPFAETLAREFLFKQE